MTSKQGIHLGIALLSVAGLAVGCGKKDPTLTAAPPAGPNAKPLPAVQLQRPRPKIGPLVDPSGKRAAGADI